MQYDQMATEDENDASNASSGNQSAEEFAVYEGLSVNRKFGATEKESITASLTEL